MAVRFSQALLVCATLVFSFEAMMVVHEAGHAAHLWATGGTVDRVVLHPLKISQTIAGENPRPLITALGGPLWGILLPLSLWAIVRVVVPSRAYLARFFAGFCLVANGAYLAGDAFVRGGDGRELIFHGAPPWLLVAAGLPAVAAGLACWNGLGGHFGSGETQGRVSRVDAAIMALLAATLVLVELALAAAWM